ncbi:MAG: TlpA disulfide reductase family protein [Planctomycetota bacterium]
MDRFTRVIVIVLASWLCTSSMAEDWAVTGRVVDENKMPVSNADVSPWWRANGSPRRADGTEYDLADRSQASQFWSNVGQMEPWQPGSRTDDQGKFRLNTQGKMHVLVMDRQRKRGAIYRLTSKSHDGVTISIAPLTKVKARVQIHRSNDKPIWSHAYVNVEQSEEHPLASTRVVSCGSETQENEFALPKGTYHLDVYAISGKEPQNIDLRVFPRPEVTVDGTGGMIDLGVLPLFPDDPDRQDLETDAKEAGRWWDHSKHFGETAPKWFAIDARGIKTGSNVGDLRGKWLLLEFWGLSCAPCLAEHMPHLMKFYDKHAEHRDKFEVIGICIDFTGKLTSIDQLDQSLRPILDNVWKRKEIPFPVVLDNTFTTWERYGIPGLGTSVLIDPQGNLVKGGTKELEKVLQSEDPTE